MKEQNEFDDLNIEPAVVARLYEAIKKRDKAAIEVEELGNRTVVEYLIAALQHKNFDVRFYAVRALELLGDKQAFEALVAASRHKDLRPSAVSALIKLGGDNAVHPTIEAFLIEEDDTRRNIVLDLIYLGESALQPLLALINHQDSSVRRNVFLGLEQMLAAASGEFSSEYQGSENILRQMRESSVVEIFINALHDEDDLTRCYAVPALESIGDKRAVPPLIVALGDEYRHVRWKAARALGELKDDSAVEPLITCLTDEEEGVRRVAVLALGNLGDSRALPALENMQVSGDERWFGKSSKEVIAEAIAQIKAKNGL